MIYHTCRGAATRLAPKKRAVWLHWFERVIEAALVAYSLWVGYHENNWPKAEYFLVLTGVVEIDDYTRRRTK